MTFRVDYDALTWARARAWFGGSSLNAVVRTFIDEYAAVPSRWMARLPPPWTPENRIRPVMNPVGAGHLAAGRTVSGEPTGDDALGDLLDSAMTEVLWEGAAPEEPAPRQA